MDKLVHLSKRKRLGSRQRQKHVVLVNPPGIPGRTNERALGVGVSRRLGPLEKESVSVPPLDLLYLAAVSERAGATVTLVDLLLERRRGARAVRFCLEKIVPRTGELWIGVRVSMPSLDRDLAFAERLKASAPEASVFVFGASIRTTLDRWVHDAAIDYVLFGEPEAFFEAMLAAIDPSRVEGVVVPRGVSRATSADRYDELKVAARAEAWVTVERLESLPRPAWHLLAMHRYAEAIGRDTPDLTLVVQASRGCPGDDAHPLAAFEGSHFRCNDVERVVDEIEFLNRSFGVYRIRFSDSNFGFSRKYARALSEAILERGVRLSAIVEARIEEFDEETLLKLREAGVDAIVSRIEPQTSLDSRLGDRVGLCRQMGFRVFTTYYLGAPEDGWDAVERAFESANDLHVESAFAVNTPLPGTSQYFRAVREGLLDEELGYARFNGYTAVMRTYALTTTDVDMARFWAKMESTIAFQMSKARAAGLLPMVGFYRHHAAHFAWRGVCRSYVRARRALPARKTVPSETAQAPVSLYTFPRKSEAAVST